MIIILLLLGSKLHGKNQRENKRKNKHKKRKQTTIVEKKTKCYIFIFNALNLKKWLGLLRNRTLSHRICDEK